MLLFYLVGVGVGGCVQFLKLRPHSVPFTGNIGLKCQVLVSRAQKSLLYDSHFVRASLQRPFHSHILPVMPSHYHLSVAILMLASIIADQRCPSPFAYCQPLYTTSIPTFIQNHHIQLQHFQSKQNNRVYTLSYTSAYHFLSF
jgi:hypothetical protein